MFFLQLGGFIFISVREEIKRILCRNINRIHSQTTIHNRVQKQKRTKPEKERRTTNFCINSWILTSSKFWVSANFQKYNKKGNETDYIVFEILCKLEVKKFCMALIKTEFGIS